MAFDTKPNLNNCKFEQCSGDIMNLSGCTQIYGYLDIECSSTFTICKDAGNNKIFTSDATGIGGWKDMVTLHIITGASNGLSYSTSDVVLGGTLDQQTTICLGGGSNTQNFFIKNSGNTSCLSVLFSDTSTQITTQCVSDTNKYHQFFINPTSLQLKSEIATDCLSSISLTAGNKIDLSVCGASSGGIFVNDNRTTKNGIQYSACYSTGFTSDCSLVDKGYVDAAVAGNTSSSGENVTKEITQAGHGFSVGDFIGWSGGTYNKAIADGNYDGEFVGLVTNVADANTFKVTQSGYVTGLTGLVTNTTYFLSPTTSGALTSTEPSTDGQISKAVLIANSSTTGWVLPYVGYVVSSGSTSLSGAENGITDNAGIVRLGGALTQNTNISGLDSYSLEFSGGTLQYSADYSSSVTARSIPDAAWVTANTSSVSFGTQYKIPYTNATGDDFDYSNNLCFNGNCLTVCGDVISNEGIVRVLCGNYGSLFWADTTYAYISNTAYNDQYGGASSAKPIVINRGSGLVGIGGNPNNNYQLYVTGSLGVNGTKLDVEGYVDTKEISAPSTPAAGYGRIYTDIADSKLKFKNDAGTVYDLTSQGDVSVSGTPSADQITLWADSSTICGDSKFTWDGSELLMCGGIDIRDANNETYICSCGALDDGNFKLTLGDICDVGNSEKFTINDVAGTFVFEGGNVGINASSPSYTLDVYGKTSICTNATSSNYVTYINNTNDDCGNVLMLTRNELATGGTFISMNDGVGILASIDHSGIGYFHGMGICCDTPSVELDVCGCAQISKCLGVNATPNSNYNIMVCQTNTNSGNAAAYFRGGLNHTSGDAFGIKAQAFGNTSTQYFGVQAYTYQSTAASCGRSYGIWGIAGNRSNCYNAGIVGHLCGSNYGAAVLGVIGSDYLITNGNCQWAGYFCGPFHTPNILDTETSCVQLGYNGTAKFCTVTDGICLGTNCGRACDWIATSDCRLKKDYQPISNALSMINSLCGIYYTSCVSEERDLGLLAQEVEKVEPLLVTNNEPNEEEKEKYGICDTIKALKYDKFSAILIEAIKEQQQEINYLRKEINELKNK